MLAAKLGFLQITQNANQNKGVGHQSVTYKHLYLLLNKPKGKHGNSWCNNHSENPSNNICCGLHIVLSQSWDLPAAWRDRRPSLLHRPGNWDLMWKITELGCGQWLGCNMSLLFSSDGKAKLQPAPGVPNITTEQHAVGSAFRVLACPAPQSTPGNILKCAWRTSLPPAGSEAVKRQLVIYFHKHSPWCWPMLLQSNKHSSLAFFWNFPCLL